MPAGFAFNIFGASSHSLDALLNPSEDVIEGLDTSIDLMRSKRGELLQEKAAGPSTNNTQSDLEKDVDFQLASSLVSHSNVVLVREGMLILEKLVFGYWTHHAECCKKDVTYKQKSEEHPSEVHSTLAYYLFYLGVGRCKTGELEKAHAVTSKMLSLQPHPQGQELLRYIESKQADETATTGILAVAGAAMAAGAALALASLIRR